MLAALRRLKADSVVFKRYGRAAGVNLNCAVRDLLTELMHVCHLATGVVVGPYGMPPGQ